MLVPELISFINRSPGGWSRWSWWLWCWCRRGEKCCGEPGLLHSSQWRNHGPFHWTNRTREIAFLIPWKSASARKTLRTSEHVLIHLKRCSWQEKFLLSTIQETCNLCWFIWVLTERCSELIPAARNLGQPLVHWMLWRHLSEGRRPVPREGRVRPRPGRARPPGAGRRARRAVQKHRQGGGVFRLTS